MGIYVPTETVKPNIRPTRSLPHTNPEAVTLIPRKPVRFPAPGDFFTEQRGDLHHVGVALGPLGREPTAPGLQTGVCSPCSEPTLFVLAPG